MPEYDEAAQWLHEHLARQGLGVVPARFEGFVLAYQHLQAMTEHLRQRSQIAVQPAASADDA
ncbi:hypothetical protein [Pseudomonas typographi]|uniref:Uncharacterized protein n=1 Tax=Pseudomonas typographi TaxID=2715964 RepID=A0ABR7Z899_9PSED|nr:hypothetical protein [Pseudomonas typographi]MBD1552041.1 hypothetical protein [Pseudomonas typographi]MBD1586604.1 hypothetical protein [Pseudomonas typographi]MBD1601756.1 hypothetical protein [Pseudomonas typographi]